MATDLDELRNHGTVSALAGSPFLLVYGFAWIAASLLTFVAPPDLAPWLYVFMGVPAAPLAILIERKAGYLPPRKADPLTPLAMQLLFLQILAFPAILLVWDASPQYMPVAFAAIVGAHFLPYQWMYRTPIYGVLAFLVALGPYVLVIIVREQALHWTGILVGVILLIGAAAVRQHARATWQRMQSQGAVAASVRH